MFLLIFIGDLKIYVNSPLRAEPTLWMETPRLLAARREELQETFAASLPTAAPPPPLRALTWGRTKPAPALWLCISGFRCEWSPGEP